MEELNELAREFYSMLNTLLCELSSEYKDMKYSLGNSYEMTINVIENPFPFSKYFTSNENILTIFLFGFLQKKKDIGIEFIFF